jgi:Transposase DDE domain
MPRQRARTDLRTPQVSTRSCDASLKVETGGALYRKRKGMIEPVFGHTKFNRRIDRFQRRGRSAARSEWRLITATHNLQKLYSHQQALATA